LPTPPPPPTSTLSPYPTLFRSSALPTRACSTTRTSSPPRCIGRSDSQPPTPAPERGAVAQPHNRAAPRRRHQRHRRTPRRLRPFTFYHVPRLGPEEGPRPGLRSDHMSCKAALEGFSV